MQVLADTAEPCYLTAFKAARRSLVIIQLNTITFCINSLSSLWLLFVVLHDKSEFR
jgi:hypothetical protein